MEKIIFPIKDPEEWGAATEGLWCRRLGEKEFEVASIPFFLEDVLPGDQIQVTVKDDALWYERTRKKAPGAVLLVYVRDAALFDSLYDKLAINSRSLEASRSRKLISVHCETDENEKIGRLLDELEGAKRVSYGYLAFRL